jgi:hypothetical protein
MLNLKLISCFPRDKLSISTMSHYASASYKHARQPKYYTITPNQIAAGGPYNLHTNTILDSLINSTIFVQAAIVSIVPGTVSIVNAGCLCLCS